MLISTRVRQISGTLSDGGRGGGGEGSDHWSVANVVDRFLPDTQRPNTQSCQKTSVFVKTLEFVNLTLSVSVYPSQ